MKEKVYITGHKNPDTDSICSALAYADLKNRRGDVEAQAIRIGELNQETKFVLDYFGVQPPEYVGTLKLKVKDLQLDHAHSVAPEISINKAIKFLQEGNHTSLPVVDEDDGLVGIVSTSNLTRSYMEVWDDRILWRAKTSVDNIIDVISAEIVNYPKDYKPYDGRIVVYVSEADQEGHVAKGDIVVGGNRDDVHREAIDRKAGILILSSGAKMKDETLELAKKNNLIVLSTKYNSFMVSRLLPQAIPLKYVMTTENLTYFHPEDFLEDVERVIKTKKYRSFPVLDHKNRVVGNISRNHLLLDRKKKLIMVDHNERNQSIDDFDTVEVVEIIDHHRVANIHTNGPIYFRNIPVGSTATIISMMFFEQGVIPSKPIAGILASAIISDTLLFRSPTTTKTDKQILMRLARIADLDVEEYAMKMFKAGTSLDNKKPSDILTADSKVFNIEEEKVKVSQTFTTDLESLGNIEERLVKRMQEMRTENGDDVFVLLITDIFAQKSRVLVVGKFGESIAKEFEEDLVECGFLVDGLLSRKKQFIPKITAAINKAKEV